MNDFLSFRRMITPTIINVIFWVLVVVVIVGTFIGIGTTVVQGFGNNQAGAAIASVCGGLIGLPIALVFVRIWCELLILFFRMNETLTDIKNALERQQK